MAGKSLEAELKRTPNNILPIFGDAVKISPNCLRGLFQTAIRTSRPDEELLQQMIRLALTEYPEEADTIAGACMEEAPEKANAIKAAFVAAPEPPKKNKENDDYHLPVTPIDRFLQAQRKAMKPAEESTKDEEADKKIQAAVAKMSAKIDEKAKITPPPKTILPDALVEEKALSGKTPEPSDNKITPEQEEQIEMISDKQIGSPFQEGITNSLEMTTENPGVNSTEPVLMHDSGNSPIPNTPELRLEKKKEPAPEKIATTPKPLLSKLQKLKTPSTVYFIPPAAGSKSAEEKPSNRQSSIILRSNPVSPTSPR